jgi:hypothetical protein
VNAFVVVQTAAVLLAGYGGAVHLARAAGKGGDALGGAALVVGALSYGAAFGFVSRESPGGRNFVFFATLALVLALTRGTLLAGGPALAFVWTSFGLAASVLGRRFDRRSLGAHGAVYLAAAAAPSGLLSAALSAFGSGPPGGAIFPGPAAAAVFLASALSSWVARGKGPTPDSFAGVAAFRAVLVAIAALGAGAAALRRLAWDVPAGRPVTLFPTFVVYGLALLAVARLGRRAAAPNR